MVLPEYQSWKVVNKIGSGSFGTVYEIQREDFGEIYKSALKVITVPQSDEEVETVRSEGLDDESITDYYESVVEEIAKEFNLMTKLKGNTNIVSYEDHQIKRHADGIGWDILVRMELLTPLSKYIMQHPISRRDVVRLGIDICKALERCRKLDIIHRDIKPDNIFLSDQGDFKLGDFGIARTAEHTMSGMSKKGTYNYMAPEVYKGLPYGAKVDIYSLGIVMYRLLNNNRLPFLPPYPQKIRFHDNEQAMLRRMSGETFPLPERDHTRLAQIVLKACSSEADYRYDTPLEMRMELEELLKYDDNLEEYLNIDTESGELLTSRLARSKSEYSKVSESIPNVKSSEPSELGEGTVSLFHQKREDAVHEEETFGKTDLSDEDGTVLLAQNRIAESSHINTESQTGKKTDIPTNQKRNRQITDSSSNRPNLLGHRFTLGNKSKKIIIASLVLAACLAITGMGVWFTQTTTIPNVAGQGQKEALKLLSDAGLQGAVGEEEYSETVEQGKVLRMECDGNEVINGGRVKKDTEITIIVSAGKKLEMKDYIGMKEGDAVEALKDLGMEASVEREYSESYDAGIVLAQDVEAGSLLRKGTAISLTVSKGSEPFAIQDLSGKTLKKAKEYANKVGLLVEIKKAYSTKIAKGCVISQVPKSGEKVSKGDALVLKISKGVEKVTVPTLVGKTEQEAQSSLEKAGLKLGKVSREYSSGTPAGYVISQTKDAGSKQEKGTAVSVTISLGEKPVQRTDTNSSTGQSNSGSSNHTSNYAGSTNNSNTRNSSSSSNSNRSSQSSSGGNNSSSNENVVHFEDMETVN